MPLSPLQIDVLKLIAANRSEAIHFAGGVVLNAPPDAPRFSHDFDIFHEAEIEVARASTADVALIRNAGYTVKEKVGAQLEKNVAAFAKLAQFSPFVAGDSLTLADCTAVTHLPLVSGATKLIYGKDFLAELPVRDYLKMMGERPHMQKVNADRKANMELMMSRMKAKN